MKHDNVRAQAPPLNPVPFLRRYVRVRPFPFAAVQVLVTIQARFTP